MTCCASQRGDAADRLSVQERRRAAAGAGAAGAGRTAVRMAIAREWVQPRWQLELTNEDATVRLEFDESGRATVMQ